MSNIDRARMLAALMLVLALAALLLGGFLPAGGGIVRALAVVIGVIAFLFCWALRPRGYNASGMLRGHRFDYRWSAEEICTFCGKGGDWNALTLRRDARFISDMAGVTICERCVRNAVAVRELPVVEPEALLTPPATTACDLCGWRWSTPIYGATVSCDGMKKHVCDFCLRELRRGLRQGIVPSGKS
jgi:hypothetical protein